MEALRERFGKYHVLERLAQGGMAEVYKVKTVGIAGFEKIQALKRILPHSAREGRFIRSFIDEARIAVELTHRNIVQVFDFGKADGELFLAMELIEGKDLRTALSHSAARDLRPPIPVSAYIVSEVAHGLDYAHRKTDAYGGSLGIVHCDVSPANVMLSADGYVKILDFGIARATFASALERRRLRGKPRYMAPEQTLGEPPTAAADVFALGIIAWELFTGLPLYQGPDLMTILEAVRRTDPPPIDQLAPEVPAEIVKAVATALSREPAQRGTSADLAAACARTAMVAGARKLSAWLAELEQRPSRAELSWQPVPHPATPPMQPSRSLTASLADVPQSRAELGEGTLAHSLDQPLPGDERPTLQRFDRTAAVAVAPRLDPTISVDLRHREPTARHEPSPDSSAQQALTEPYSRPSHESLVSARPSSLRLDDEATQHGFAVPPVGPEDTSYDDLEVEPVAADAGAMLPADEPIDDELGAIATGALGSPAARRIVIVAGLLANAPVDVVRPVARTLGELAYQRGGVVIGLDDDALVVAFGLEVAGEDDVAIAMGWALDAGAIARDAGGEHGGIELRIGARAGVGTLREDALVAGSDRVAAHVPQDAIAEARALARDAAPDRPLFTGGAGRLTSGLYALREVPPARRIARRGRPPHSAGRSNSAGGSRVMEVVGPRGFEERDRARLGRHGKFVGRRGQLAELDAWFQRALDAGRRCGVLIRGAAGTGKSRLVAELVARRTAADSRLRVVTTAASPASRLAPFALVIELYQAALGLAPARGRVARRQVVDRLLHLLSRGGLSTPRARAVAIDLDRAMELRDGVGVGAPEVADLRPRISAGLAAFRMVMADGERPLLTIIEDVHLADSASLEVLRHTLAVPAHGPELLVLTARPEGAAPPAVDTVLAIGDLVGGELRALIADRLGDAASPVNIAAVLARAGGNPLFVEELAQAVREAGPTGEEVPASARDVVMGRMERLSPGARAAVRFAAVLGNTVRVRLLEELLGGTANPDDAAVPAREPELDELVQAGFLIRPEASAGSSEGELAFARGLVREVVYDALSARAQRESHARVGRLLASRFFAGREEPPATIAEHLERGGELAGAAAFWLRAGRLAIAACDAEAAIACFSRTLSLDRELGAIPPTQASRVRRREALAGREEAHRLQGDLASDQLASQPPARTRSPS